MATEQTQQTQRRAVPTGLLIGLLIAACVAAAGGFVLLRPGDPLTPRSSGPVPASTPPASASTPSSSGAAGPSDPSDTAALTSPPRGVTWKKFRGLALPSSANAGPLVIDGPVLRNYEQNPAGALIAATQISARYLITPGGRWRQVLQEQVMPGPGRDAFERLRAQLTDEAPASGFAQFAGFRFVTYTPDLAVISLANRAASGATTVTNTTVHWLQGDWKVEIPASGLAQPQAVTDLSGYIPWSGTP